jgi:hypothetical protein
MLEKANFECSVSARDGGKYSLLGAGAIVMHNDPKKGVVILLAKNRNHGGTQSNSWGIPSETMKSTKQGEIEDHEHALSRCFGEELGINASNLPILYDADCKPLTYALSIGREKPAIGYITLLHCNSPDMIPRSPKTKEIEKADYFYPDQAIQFAESWSLPLLDELNTAGLLVKLPMLVNPSRLPKVVKKRYTQDLRNL